MDAILLLRFDETYEPTFRRPHRAKPFSYVHLTVSSANEIDPGRKGGGIFSFLFYGEKNFSEKLNEDGGLLR